tara:strand:+ start:1234 stop:2115 length:882 start_codon:yes stop_codon:yes gene_type:complete
MLGSMVADVLSLNSQYKVTATVRSLILLKRCQLVLPEVQWQLWDAFTEDENELNQLMTDCDWVINAIGITKPYINDQDPQEVERAVIINSLLPYRLARSAAVNSGVRIIQIATDCVFSGSKGNYSESDSHDPLDVYGKTKSLGECNETGFHNLRCSIIGPEFKDHSSLLGWFRGQSKGAGLNGFTNHDWNGVTTFHFARLCEGIISSGLDLGNVQHIVPSGRVTKYELLNLFRKSFDRGDLVIRTAEADQIIDRTLLTKNSDMNSNIWASAGYLNSPTIEGMIKELADFDYRF